IPNRYSGLIQSDSEDPAVRTRWNVRDSDGTVILSHGALQSGSRLTADVAMELGKPLLHLDLGNMDVVDAAEQLRKWIEQNEIQTLNVAGPRQSQDAAIYEQTRSVLTRTFRRE